MLVETFSALTESWLTPMMIFSMLSAMLVLLVQRGKFLYALRNVPYPTALPVIGNAYQLNCSTEEFFKKLVKWAEQFGDIYLLWVGMRPFIFLYKAEAVQPLLKSSTHIDKSLEYEYLKPWLGTGLVTSNGEIWHRRRKMLSSTFHSCLLSDYLKIVVRESDILISCMKKEIGKSGFNMVSYAKRATLDVICDSAMGIQLNAQNNYNNEYVIAVDKVASIMQMRFTNIWISFDPIFKMTRWGKEHDSALRIINELVGKVVADRKTEWISKRDGNFNEPTTRKQAMLDLLLEMSHKHTDLTDEDIRDEVNTFMYAGHDTTATSVSWTLYALGRHPEYQKKILDEFEEVIGTKEITLDNLNKLVWLDACIKEQWRLYAVAPLIARQIYKPIEIMGNVIPPGSTVLINSYLLHRDPRHFPDPHVYRPERFLPDSPKFARFAFIPFSAGSRNCIGWKFATIIVKVIVLSILRSYHVEALDREDQLRFISELVLVNAGGIRLKVTSRDQHTNSF
ncbi:PREDICTED: cytochrome P450 4c3-like [Dinoponera quadriceps]|uniref:Cytochrome P450 4c3-like n=1 Tax=Dinoponera quadriceps TaxID=609295 RepID=A0A6P3X8M3_DINQU|nr:PREDICTED: cytochrome P450 4c3-like [Dinoponera quadriceps]